MARTKLTTAELEAIWTAKHARKDRMLQKAAAKRVRVAKRLKDVQNQTAFDAAHLYFSVVT